jgi:hypothetical protein
MKRQEFLLEMEQTLKYRPLLNGISVREDISGAESVVNKIDELNRQIASRLLRRNQGDSGIIILAIIANIFHLNDNITPTKCLKVVEGKNKQYSQEQDAFSNWKKAGEILDIKVWKVILAQITVKVERLKTTPDHEDSIIDLVNYFAILYVWLTHKPLLAFT